MSLPDTRSQQWARNGNACLAGRRRLGKRSIAEYWRTTKQVNDLIWIALHLALPPMSNETYNVIRANYVRDVHRCDTSGRWSALHTRQRLLQVFAQYRVQFPAELL